MREGLSEGHHDPVCVVYPGHLVIFRILLCDLSRGTDPSSIHCSTAILSSVRAFISVSREGHIVKSEK